MTIAVLLIAGRALAQAEVPVASTLTPEQAALAQRMETFMADRQQWYFGELKRINGEAGIETRVWNFDDADHTVSVTRGPVIEKAAWYLNVAKKGIPPFIPSVRYARYMEVDLHPHSPHAGFLHATLFLTFLDNGKSMMAGYMDYVPAVWHEDDNLTLKNAVDAVYARHGVDITRFRKQLCESKFGATHHRDRLKAACVGASLYDPPMMEVTEPNFALATEAWQAFVSTYLGIVEKRAHEKYTEADLRAQESMRKRWLEDQLFADTFTVKVVPYEVWSFADQAPAVHF
jgi:coproporphyrinogen III oxidase